MNRQRKGELDEVNAAISVMRERLSPLIEAKIVSRMSPSGGGWTNEESIKTIIVNIDVPPELENRYRDDIEAITADVPFRVVVVRGSLGDGG